MFSEIGMVFSTWFSTELLKTVTVHSHFSRPRLRNESLKLRERCVSVVYRVRVITSSSSVFAIESHKFDADHF